MAKEDFTKYWRGNCEQSLRRHMIYSGLLDCLPLKPLALESIMRNWELTAEKVDKLQIAAVPPEFSNTIIANNIAMLYGDLSDIPGFVYRRENWRLDVSTHLSNTGFLVPKRSLDARIDFILVYRSVMDENPFRLQTRKNSKYAAA